MRTEAFLLTVGVFLGVGRGASALGAGRYTLVGVVGLVVAGARHLEACGDTADVLGVACSRVSSRPK